MNRRGFFGRILGLAVALSLPVETLAEKNLIQVPPRVPDPGIMGYKGASFLETGMVYAPYIPLHRTPDLVMESEMGNKFLERFSNSRGIDFSLYKTVRIGDDIITKRSLLSTNDQCRRTRHYSLV